MPSGIGEIVYISDEDENVGRVSTLGRAYLAESYSRVKNHSPINVSAASGGTGFESIAVGRVVLRSESGNAPMWWGGTGDDAPYSGKGLPLYGGQKTPYLPVTNFNSLRVVSSISGQILYAIGFLNGFDIILPNNVAEQPPVPIETIPPIVVTHSPVSGLSGVSLNSEIRATFNEEISSDSVTSGSFRLSPAHNVNIFRHVTDENTIVMVPNVNLSGTTVYYAGINSQITDLAGNSVSGTSGGVFVFTWPFTTIATPPPPDVTAPVVSGTNPASGATNVSASTNVTIIFSEPMLSGSITPLNIYLSYLSGVVSTSGISGVVTLSAVDSKTATIDPTPTTLSGSSNVKINVLSGVRDLAGNNIVTDRSRNFTIAVADVTKPTVTSTSPANGATNVSQDTSVVVVFSEPMLSGTINTTNLFLSTTQNGSANPTDFVVSLSGNQRAAAINPTDTLNGSYFINVLTGVQDLAGNAMLTADRSRSFSTIYNFQQVYLVTGSGTGDMYDGNDEKLGLVITGSCDLLGSAPKKIVVRLRKNGSPTGTASITLRKGSDDSIVKTFGTINVASLTSSYQDFTFTDLTQTYQMVVGDMILVEYTGGSSSNRLEIQRTSSGDAYEGADYVQDDGSGYNPDSGKDVAWDIYE